MIHLNPSLTPKTLVKPRPQNALPERATPQAKALTQDTISFSGLEELRKKIKQAGSLYEGVFPESLKPPIEERLSPNEVRKLDSLTHLLMQEQNTGKFAHKVKDAVWDTSCVALFKGSNAKEASEAVNTIFERLTEKQGIDHGTEQAARNLGDQLAQGFLENTYSDIRVTPDPITSLTEKIGKGGIIIKNPGQIIMPNFPRPDNDEKVDLGKMSNTQTAQKARLYNTAIALHQAKAEFPVLGEAAFNQFDQALQGYAQARINTTEVINKLISPDETTKEQALIDLLENPMQYQATLDEISDRLSLFSKGPHKSFEDTIDAIESLQLFLNVFDPSMKETERLFKAMSLFDCRCDVTRQAQDGSMVRVNAPNEIMKGVKKPAKETLEALSDYLSKANVFSHIDEEVEKRVKKLSHRTPFGF